MSFNDHTTTAVDMMSLPSERRMEISTDIIADELATMADKVTAKIKALGGTPEDCFVCYVLGVNALPEMALRFLFEHLVDPLDPETQALLAKRKQDVVDLLETTLNEVKALDTMNLNMEEDQ